MLFFGRTKHIVVTSRSIRWTLMGPTPAS